MHPMAGYDNVTGLRVCDWDIVPVRTKSRKCSLGSPKTAYGLFGVNKRPVAHLWRMGENSN